MPGWNMRWISFDVSCEELASVLDKRVVVEWIDAMLHELLITLWRYIMKNVHEGLSDAFLGWWSSRPEDSLGDDVVNGLWL